MTKTKEERIWLAPAAFKPIELKDFEHFAQLNAQDYGWLKKFSELLWRRGWRESNAAATFLAEDRENTLTSFQKLFDSEKAAALIAETIKLKQKILIFGDYDVDGISSTALLWRFLYQELKADVTPYLPNRAKEGYGLNRSLLEEALQTQDQEPQLLITLDCGIRDRELLLKLKADYPNLKVIVTDHHQLPEGKNVLPEVDCIVHPMLAKSDLIPNEICATAIAWNLTQALRAYYNLPLTSKGLELVALATVCDLMPLTGINRSYVQLGLKEFAITENIGLIALMHVAAVDPKKIGSYELGFQLGPRINATGRIGDPVLALKLLCTSSPENAQRMAAEVNKLNQERQNITQSHLEEITNHYQTKTDLEPIIFLERENLPEGILGLIAGKLQERYKRPVLVVSQNTNGDWVGSARSIQTFNITDLLGRSADLLVKYGGHAQAAGFTVTPSNLAKLKEAILTDELTQTLSNRKHDHSKSYELDLLQAEADLKLIKDLELLQPFGNQNPRPLVRIQDLKATATKQFGNQGQHRRFTIESNQQNLQVVGFNQADEINLATYQFVGYLGYNEYKSIISPQLIIQNP